MFRFAFYRFLMFYRRRHDSAPLASAAALWCLYVGIVAVQIFVMIVNARPWWFPKPVVSHIGLTGGIGGAMLLAIPYFAWIRNGAYLKFHDLYENELPSKKRARTVVFWLWLGCTAAFDVGFFAYHAAKSL